MIAISITNYRINTNFASPCRFKHRAVIRPPSNVGLDYRLETLQAIWRKPVLDEFIAHPILHFFYSILSIELRKGFTRETR